MVGPVADRTIAGFSLDLCVIGADGVSPLGVSTHDQAEAATNRALLEAADKCIVAVDHTKLGTTMFSQICGLENVHFLLTTGGPPDDITAALDRHGVQLILADLSDAGRSARRSSAQFAVAQFDAESSNGLSA